MAKKYFCMALTAIFAAVSLYAQSESDFTVKLNDAGDGVVVTGYSGKITKIVIPATIQGLPVRELQGREMFNRIEGLSSVTLPEGLIEIGESVFESHYSILEITTLTLPSTLKTIGNSAFRKSKLTKMIIPDSVDNLGSDIFAYSNLSEVKLPKTLKVIPRNAFSPCENLASIALPEGLEEIGEGAFSSTKLTKIILPKSIKKIGYGAFGYCSELTEVVFPANAEKIEFNLSDVFSDCPKLSLATQAKIRQIIAKKEAAVEEKRLAKEAAEQAERERVLAEEQAEQAERERVLAEEQEKFMAEYEKQAAAEKARKEEEAKRAAEDAKKQKRKDTAKKLLPW